MNPINALRKPSKNLSPATIVTVPIPKEKPKMTQPWQKITQKGFNEAVFWRVPTALGQCAFQLSLMPFGLNSEFSGARPIAASLY